METSHYPTITTTFLGREAELAEIERLLADPACRLLTLVGPGGIGKTRLAMEASWRQALPDGHYFVPFQPLTSSEFMVSTIADAVGFQFYAGAEPKRQLLNYLRDKALLLVMDNLEHLLDGVTLLSDILAAAPGVRILATSRERLNLREEWVLEVGGLRYPAEDEEGDIEAYSAIALFAHHARRASASFRLTNEEKPAIIRVCRLVGGMPLGIELAAAWVRVMSCQQIAAEIEHSLDILETPARNTEPRHRTMRATLDQSWNLLSETERELFRRLSVFRGGFTREAAEQVAGASLRTLSVFVDKSLIRVDGDGRYDLHELLRQYAEEKLAEIPEEQEQMRDRHCIYYADFIGQWADDPIGLTENQDSQQIIENLDNVRAAFRRSIDLDNQHEMGKFLPTLPHFYDLVDRYQEGVEVCWLVAESVRKVAGEKSEHQQRLLGLALAFQSRLLNFLLRTEEARILLRDSLTHLLPLQRGREIVYTYVFLCQLGGDLPEMKHFAKEALKSAQAINFEWGIVASLHQLGWAARELGEYEEALKPLEEALRLCRKRTQRWLWGESWTLMHLSWVAYDQQRWTEAKQWSKEGLAISEAIRNQLAALLFHGMLGGIAYQCGEYSEAKPYLQESLVLAQKLGNRKHILLAHNDLGRLETRLGNGHEAREHFRETLKMALETQDNEMVLYILAAAADLVATEGNTGRAVELLAHPVQNSQLSGDSRLWIGHLNRQLETDLAPDVYAAARERGMKRTADAMGAELLAEFSQPDETHTNTPPTSRGIDPLNEREIEILLLVADGLSNREIADQKVLAVSTVKWYLNEIFSKLHVSNRTQAVARARTLGLLS